MSKVIKFPPKARSAVSLRSALAAQSAVLPFIVVTFGLSMVGILLVFTILVAKNSEIARQERQMDDLGILFTRELAIAHQRTALAEGRNPDEARRESERRSRRIIDEVRGRGRE